LLIGAATRGVELPDLAARDSCGDAIFSGT
jgi:hypothetical protein